MKAVFRRLRRLEQAPGVRLACSELVRAAELLRARRRRRLEAAGEPVDELDWASLSLPAGTRLTEGDTLRLARPLIWKRQRERAERDRLLTGSPGDARTASNRFRY